MRMCNDYRAEAKHFPSQGDLIRAFGAIDYANDWIDVTVRIGLVGGHSGDRLFILPQINE